MIPPAAILLICQDALKILDDEEGEGTRHALRQNIRMMVKVIDGEFPKDEQTKGTAMKKITTLFQRNHDGYHLVRNEVVPGAEWVLIGEGKATRKWDGTCCVAREGKLYKRYTLKRGRTASSDFEPATEVDSETGKQEGWVPVTGSDKWHIEALRRRRVTPDGTYELLGPKIQGNPERIAIHVLYPHGVIPVDNFPRSFDDIREWFRNPPVDIEGVVWHHPDGRMVKIKASDFGCKRLANSPVAYNTEPSGDAR